MPKNYNFLISVLIMCLMFFYSINVSAFPKKNKSLIKDDAINIPKADKFEERLIITGYYLGIAEFCNYQGLKNSEFGSEYKDFVKRVKGAVAYTNWTLFRILNSGVQLLEGDLFIAGIGWAGGGTWQSKQIDWRHEVSGCDNATVDLIYPYLDEIVKSGILFYLYNISAEDFDKNVNDLINLLSNDRRDDYGMIINKINLILENDELMNDVRNLYGLSKKNDGEIKLTNEDENSNTENEKGTLEEKLKKLKGLFDKELITKDEYDTKRLEILDSF